MNFRNIYNELKRRNVIKVATVYGITAWVIAQIVALATNAFGAPDWVLQMVIVLLVVGFPLALIFAWAFEMTPDGIRKTEDVGQAASQTQKTGNKLNWMIIGALALLLVVVGAERIFFAGSYSEPSITSEANQASIAVLPFESISSNEGDTYFAEGLSEELLNELARVDKMKVAGRTSSFQFKGAGLDMQQIGSQLDVQNILEGSVRKAGNKVRITVQLINTKSGDYVWSQTYDRTLDDIFAIQEDISKAVLAELKVRLLPQEKKQLETIPTGDIESYQLYLKANQVIASRRLEDINLAIDLYQQAIDLDPGFAKAHAKLATAYYLNAEYGGAAINQMQPKIQQHAEKALMLNRNLAEGYAAVGLYYLFEGQRNKAQKALQRSLEIKPNQPSVLNSLAALYINSSNYMQGMDVIEKAYQLDPLAPVIISNFAIANLFQGRTGKAQELLQKNIRINPDYLSTYLVLGASKVFPPTGRLDKAVEYILRALQKDGRITRAKYLMTGLLAELRVTQAASYYYQQLKKEAGGNFDFIITMPAHAELTGNYAPLDTVFFPFIERHGLGSMVIEDIRILSIYAYSTGNYDKVLKIYKQRVPGLFDEKTPTVSRNNYEYANELINIYEAKGENARAQELVEAYCAGLDEVATTFPDGKETPNMVEARANCLLHQGEYQQALPLVKQYFLQLNGIYQARYKFQSLMYIEALQQPEYQEIRDQVYAELARQRANVIKHLKEADIWKPAWSE